MLSQRFITYVQQTSNLCIHRLGDQALSPTLSFPAVRTVTLTQCTPKGVSRILTPKIFPNLKAVHYLSANPGQLDIYKHFPSVQWLFPNGRHLFYKCMMEEGIGRIEHRLIRTYIHHYRKTEGEDMLQINVPWYGVEYAPIYRAQLHHYLKNQHRVLTTEYDIEETISDVNPFDHYTHFDCGDVSVSLHEFMQQKMEREFFDALMEQDRKQIRY
jgi:hypothetical protein